MLPPTRRAGPFWIVPIMMLGGSGCSATLITPPFLPAASSSSGMPASVRPAVAPPSWRRLRRFIGSGLRQVKSGRAGPGSGPPRAFGTDAGAIARGGSGDRGAAQAVVQPDARGHEVRELGAVQRREVD